MIINDVDITGLETYGLTTAELEQSIRQYKSWVGSSTKTLLGYVRHENKDHSRAYNFRKQLYKIEIARRMLTGGEP